MNIQGLDYNTGREKLLLTEYGREIQKMVDHAITLPTREERMKCARSIVRMMKTKVAMEGEIADSERAIWDHLYLMSHQQLDIDWPFDVSEVEKSLTKPQPLPLPQGSIAQRHYGRLVEELWEKLKTMPEGAERDQLARYTANQMKRDLVTWGHGSIEDAKVIDDLARFTDGVVQLNPSTFSFAKVTPVTMESGKRKKKK
jgi:hypothetical protein